MGNVIGIDLGTTNSCVAIVEDGTPTVIANRGGYRVTPSMVAIVENGRRLVGHVAKRQAITNAENTVSAVKRLIGRQWDAPQVQAAVDMVPYTVVEGPHGDVRVVLRGQQFSIPEISAQVLQEMKLIAEDYLGEEARQAVITVPAYFNDGQRQATKDAGQIAGLDVIRIINEPTAAALAYGLGKESERRIAVYDLGGGTFDISILQISQGVFEVLATAGDTFLGGEDFDRRVVDWLVFGFAKEHRIDLRRDKMALQRLKDIAERAKCELSTLRETEIQLPFVVSSGENKPLHLQRRLSRQKLEELTLDLVDRTIETCRHALAEAGIERQQLDEVVLVGGQTRMPRVQQRVAEFFGRQPCKGVHPDEVVALGAAIQGAALVGRRQEVLLLDVTPHALGIMIVGGYFHKLIERNTTVPTAKSHVFTTIKDNQTSVQILVLQGESERAEESQLLGEFTLSGLRRAPRGEVEVEVSFEISADGIVAVSAKDMETGQQQSITVTAHSGLTAEEVRRMAARQQDYLVEVRASEELAGHRQQVERLGDEVAALLPRVEGLQGASGIGEDVRQRAHAALERAERAAAEGDPPALAEAAEALERSLRMLKALASKANGR